MTSGIFLNYRKLWRSSTGVWFVMLLATFLPVLVAVMVIDANKRCFFACPEPELTDQALRALVFTLPLAIGGLLVGWWRNAKGRKHVGQAFDVQYLGEGHELTQRVHRLADQLGLPRPAVGIMAATNAFAVGARPEDGAVIIGEPLLTRLAPDELDAVIGHELGHIASGDVSRMQMALGYQSFLDWLFIAAGTVFSLSALIAGKIASRAAGDARSGSYVSRALVVLAQSTMKLCATLSTRAFSRRREFYADAIGALLTSSEAMQRALVKIHRFADPATAGEKDYKMLMFRAGSGGHPFATHPTLENRVFALREKRVLRKLERMAGGRRKQPRPETPTRAYQAPAYRS